MNKLYSKCTGYKKSPKQRFGFEPHDNLLLMFLSVNVLSRLASNLPRTTPEIKKIPFAISVC